MVIKSGEGVVYLTRPQKFSQSSPYPEGLTFFSPATQTLLPRPTKTDANSPNMALILSKYGDVPQCFDYDIGQPISSLNKT